MQDQVAHKMVSIPSGEFKAERACPLCGSHSQQVSVQANAPAETLDFTTIKRHWVTSFDKGTFFTFCRCEDCGMLYSPTYFTGQALSHLYENMPENNHGIPVDSLIKTQKGYFDFLNSRADVSGNYMEIGPDVGHFTKLASNGGKIDHAWLFEPNMTTHAALRTAVRAKQVHLSTEMESFDKVPDASLSVAVLIHVLDHVIHPKKTLASIAQKMKPGGAILIVTHDEKSLLARTLGSRFPPFCLQHPHLFNPSSTAKMLSASGFENIETKKCYNYFPVAHLTRHALNLVGLPPRIVPEMSSLQLPLKLGNIMTVAFRTK